MRRRRTLLPFLLLAALLRLLAVGANLSTNLIDALLDVAEGIASLPAVLTALQTASYLEWDTVAYTVAGTGGTAVTTGQVTGSTRTSVPPSSWGAASAGAKANTTAVTGFASVGGTGATVVAASFWSLVTAGVMTKTITLGSSFSYAPEVTPTVAIGALTDTLT